MEKVNKIRLNGTDYQIGESFFPDEPILIQDVPESVTVAINNTFVVSCFAIGKNITYTWEFGSDGGTTWKETRMNGSNVYAYPVNTYNSAEYKFRCRISNDKKTIYTSVTSETVVN